MVKDREISTDVPGKENDGKTSQDVAQEMEAMPILSAGHTEGNSERRPGQITEVAVDQDLMPKKPGPSSGDAGEILEVSQLCFFAV